MMQEHLDALIRESEDDIADLNTALLALEAEPTDQAAMDDVFRIAHTLKGNFAAAGFEAPSTLAHALEDLLEAVRSGSRSLTPELMDVAFEAVDRMELAVEQIESDGAVSIDPEATVTTIREILESDSESGTSAEADRNPSHTTGLPVDPSSLSQPEDRVFHLACSADRDGMASVDCFLAIESLGDSVEQLVTTPDVQRIESEDGVDRFDALVEVSDRETLDSILESLGSVTVETVEDITSVLEPDLTGDDTGSGAAREQPAVDRTSPDDVKSVRVDVEQLDELYGLVEGLVTSRIKLRRAIDSDNADAATSTLDELEKITAGLQDTVMDMRLIPLKKVVTPLPRLVRDLARDQEKDVAFEMHGTDIELDRSILTQLGDPLVHIIRNAVDHGIEPPEVREAAGKSRTGTIELTAERERDHVIVTVRDDGRGLDRESIAAKALEKGIRTADELDGMDDSAVYQLIFHAGFSTREEVTDVSGRGVGMDVVNETVHRLDGSVHVDSDPGAGTSVQLRLPVSVAIVKMLFLKSAGREFGIPLKQVDEVGRGTETDTIQGQEVIEHGDEIYPVLELSDALDLDDEPSRRASMLIRVRPEYRPIALRCERVTTQEEVVVKPLEGILADVEGLSGTAVLGDGDIVPILDVRTIEGGVG